MLPNVSTWLGLWAVVATVLVVCRRRRVGLEPVSGSQLSPLNRTNRLSLHRRRMNGGTKQSQYKVADVECDSQFLVSIVLLQLT